MDMAIRVHEAACRAPLRWPSRSTHLGESQSQREDAALLRSATLCSVNKARLWSVRTFASTDHAQTAAAVPQRSVKLPMQGRRHCDPDYAARLTHEAGSGEGGGGPGAKTLHGIAAIMLPRSVWSQGRTHALSGGPNIDARQTKMLLSLAGDAEQPCGGSVDI